MNRGLDTRGTRKREGEEKYEENYVRKSEKRDTHVWYCDWMKLNSSLIRSQVSATVNFSPPAAPPLPPPPCKKKEQNEGIRLAMHDNANATEGRRDVGGHRSSVGREEA